MIGHRGPSNASRLHFLERERLGRVEVSKGEVDARPRKEHGTLHPLLLPRTERFGKVERTSIFWTWKPTAAGAVMPNVSLPVVAPLAKAFGRIDAVRGDADDAREVSVLVKQGKDHRPRDARCHARPHPRLIARGAHRLSELPVTGIHPELDRDAGRVLPEGRTIPVVCS